MKPFVYILGVTSGMTWVLGIFFKGQHWPGAGVIIGFAMIVTLIFIPLFAIYSYRKEKD